MERVKLVEKRAKLSSTEKIVKLQLILYCFANDIHLTPGDYNLLTYIAINGYNKKTSPIELVQAGVFLHKQSVRNSRLKLLKQGFLIEEGKKSYKLNPNMEIESHGSIMVDFKAIAI